MDYKAKVKELIDKIKDDHIFRLIYEILIRLA